jgi:putative peptidoglycan binding protein
MPKRKSRKVPRANTARTDADSRAARLGMLIVQHPREFVGLLMATLATGWIFANALFLQNGPHPAPIFAPPKQMSVPAAALAPNAGMQPVNAVPMPQPAPQRQAEPGRRTDPIAVLLAPSPRIRAVQQALALYAYGPVGETGVYDLETRNALIRFQEARGLTPNGQLDARTSRELSKITGRPLE